MQPVASRHLASVDDRGYSSRETSRHLGGEAFSVLIPYYDVNNVTRGSKMMTFILVIMKYILAKIRLSRRGRYKISVSRGSVKKRGAMTCTGAKQWLSTWRRRIKLSR